MSRKFNRAFWNRSMALLFFFLRFLLLNHSSCLRFGPELFWDLGAHTSSYNSLQSPAFLLSLFDSCILLSCFFHSSHKLLNIAIIGVSASLIEGLTFGEQLRTECAFLFLFDSSFLVSQLLPPFLSVADCLCILVECFPSFLVSSSA